MSGRVQSAAVARKSEYATFTDAANKHDNPVIVPRTLSNDRRNAHNQTRACQVTVRIRAHYNTVADDAMTLQDRDSASSMHVIVVLYEVLIGHALFLLYQYRSFDDFAEAGGVGVAGLEGLGHHVGQRK